MYIQMCVYIYIYIYMYVCIYIYIYMYMHIHKRPPEVPQRSRARFEALRSLSTRANTSTSMLMITDMSMC